MPGGDRTGPNGMGPMTGRGAGYCAGYQVPGYTNPVGSRGFGAFGRGRGMGRGRGRGFGAYAAPMPMTQPQQPITEITREDELVGLSQQLESKVRYDDVGSSRFCQNRYRKRQGRYRQNHCCDKPRMRRCTRGHGNGLSRLRCRGTQRSYLPQAADQ